MRVGQGWWKVGQEEVVVRSGTGGMVFQGVRQGWMQGIVYGVGVGVVEHLLWRGGELGGVVDVKGVKSGMCRERSPSSCEKVVEERETCLFRAVYKKMTRIQTTLKKQMEMI